MHQIQFSHANGFPARTYTHLFRLLEDAKIHHVDRLGHGDFALNGDLSNLATELIHSIEQRDDGPVIGIGHSSGAVATLLAASRKPELFSQVILIEPAFFSSWKRGLIRMAMTLGFGDRLGPTSKAVRRRDHFPDVATARDYFLQRRLFQLFHPQCFEDYLAHGLKPADSGGMELAFSKQIEVEIFRSTQTKAPKNLTQLKGSMIYGDTSELFWKSDVRWWKRALPNIQTIPFSGGHLFPLEQPDKTAELINALL